jgi:transposase InsO family protein/transposase-like protein
VELARLREQPIAKIAQDLGISESCLRRWTDQADVDEGRKEGLSTDERAELVRLRRQVRVKEMEIEILKRASACFTRENVPPKKGSGWSESSPRTGSTSRWPAGCCTCLGRGTTSGGPGHRPRRDLEDAYLANTIVDVHAMSRCSYGAPRVHAELRLGMGIRVGRKRVARLMRLVGRRGIAHRHKRRHRPEPAVHQDLVQRRFVASGPDRRWCTDITEHPTSAGKVYCCAVLDVFTRQIVGGSIPRATLPHPLRTGRRRPADGDLATPTDRHHRPQKPGVPNTPHGSSAPAAHRRPARLHGPSRLQRRQLDDRIVLVHHATRAVGPDLVADTRAARHRHLRMDRSLVNPRRRHTALDMLSPVAYEQQWQATTSLPTAADGAA